MMILIKITMEKIRTIRTIILSLGAAWNVHS